MNTVNSDQLLNQITALLATQKIITPKLKGQLLSLGFIEVSIGTKKEHEILSKQVKHEFHGHDIAIGLSPIAISYSSRRKYFALVYNFKK